MSQERLFNSTSFQYNFLSFSISLVLTENRARPFAPLLRGQHRMELVVRKNDLLRELQLFQGIVERKNTIPILANVLIEARGDEVQLLATDLEVGLRSRCEASVSKAGALTLPAKKLYEIVKALPDTDVRIEQDQTSVKVAADRFDSRMQTLPREDFPTVPEATGEGGAVAAGHGAAGDDCAHAVRHHGEDTRYFLNGAQLVLKDER